MKKLLSQFLSPSSFFFIVLFLFMFSVFLVHELSHMYRLQTRTEKSRVCVGERQSESDSVQIVPLIINDSWYHEFLFHISYMTRFCFYVAHFLAISDLPHTPLRDFFYFSFVQRKIEGPFGSTSAQTLEFFIYLNSDFVDILYTTNTKVLKIEIKQNSKRKISSLSMTRILLRKNENERLGNK